MFTLAFAGIETDSNVFYGLTLVILILTIIQTLIFYRCPHCGRLLYTRSAPPLIVPIAERSCFLLTGRTAIRTGKPPQKRPVVHSRKSST